MPSGSAPLIETARLRLRGFLASDLDAMAAMNADPRAVRYTGGNTHSREETWRRMLAGPGLWHMLGYGHWAVERKEDGMVLGHVGFADYKRDMIPSIEGEPEMGWFFAVHAHGQGYASEAVAAALVWADKALAGQQIAAIIDPPNKKSIRVAEKAGFKLRGNAAYREDWVLLFSRRAGSPASASASATTAA